MNLFPAILLGGPPHRGKSVLAYSLSRALRERGVHHYVLRAAPDSEGDWANEADASLVRILRVKSAFTPAFVQHVRRSLAQRHLPLLVDVGGLPTPEQEVIFDECTHAILLYADEPELAAWQSLIQRHNLIPVAYLRSALDAPDAITEDGLILRGTIGGLARGATASGAMVQALVERIAGIFAYSTEELLKHNPLDAPPETVRVCDDLATVLDVPHEGKEYRWSPAHLQPLLEFLPAGQPLAIFGRGPVWLYAALAAHAHPAPFWLFDARLGWVTPLNLPTGEMPPAAPLQIEMHTQPDHVRLEFRLRSAHLEYEEARDWRIPFIVPSHGVILSGKLPNWLWTSLTLAYRHLAWVAVYQPPLNDAVVVVRRGANALPIGTLRPLA